MMDDHDGQPTASDPAEHLPWPPPARSIGTGRTTGAARCGRRLDRTKLVTPCPFPVPQGLIFLTAVDAAVWIAPRWHGNHKHSTETESAMDGDRTLDDTDLSRLIAKLADPDGAGRRQRDSVIRTWVTWQQPVEAGCYTDLDALDTIRVWVEHLHEERRIKPDVRFTLEEDTGVAVGVLYDPGEILARWAVLRRNRYIVRTGDKLEVLDPTTFHSRYCDVAYCHDLRRSG